MQELITCPRQEHCAADAAADAALAPTKEDAQSWAVADNRCSRNEISTSVLYAVAVFCCRVSLASCLVEMLYRPLL